MSDATTPVILSACRTPIGKFLGGLSTLTAPQLGAVVVREAVKRSGIEGSADRRSDHGPRGPGRLGPGPGAAGADPWRRARLGPGAHHQQGLRLGPQGRDAGRAEHPGRRRRVRRGRRHGVDVRRAALPLRLPGRHQGRQPDHRGRDDPRRPLGLLRPEPHGGVRRVHRRRRRGSPGRSRTSSRSRATARRSPRIEAGQFAAEIVPVPVPGKGGTGPVRGR